MNMKNILTYLISSCASISMTACSHQTVIQTKNDDYQLVFYVDSIAWDNPKLKKMERITISDCDKIKKTKLFVRNLFKTAKEYNPPSRPPKP